MRNPIRRARGFWRMATCGALAAISASVLGPGIWRAEAQVSPNGGEFQVNTYTTSVQLETAVASDAQGNFVIVWTSLGSSGTDTSAFSVQARRYAANGAPLGAQFQVNTYTLNSQQDSAVASDALGNFVIVWTSYGSSGTDTSSYSVHSRLYDSDGNPLGGELQVNTYTTSFQLDAAVASDPSGNFVVAWRSNGSIGTDTSGASIQAQRYAAGGAPLGGEFQVNTYTTNSPISHAVTSDASGTFIFTWDSDGSSGTDTSLRSVQAQRYGANGAPLGGQFQVNTYTPDSQNDPAVGSDAQGNFVIAWRSYGSTGTDTSLGSVQAQLYDASGSPIGGQFQVNMYTTSSQLQPAVARNASGAFVVAWGSYGSSDTDLSGGSIQARRYAANGAPLAGDFQVNTYTMNNQRDPALATDASGNFVVAWGSYGSSGSDLSGYSVQAQRYDGLFRDGFETGDTSRWSAAVP